MGVGRLLRIRGGAVASRTGYLLQLGVDNVAQRVEDTTTPQCGPVTHQMTLSRVLVEPSGPGARLEVIFSRVFLSFLELGMNSSRVFFSLLERHFELSFLEFPCARSEVDRVFSSFPELDMTSSRVFSSQVTPK